MPSHRGKSDVAERQAYAFARPVHDPARTASEFREVRRVAAGVLITILTVNR